MNKDGAARGRLPPDELLRRLTHLIDLSGGSPPAQGFGDEEADANLIAACAAATGMAMRKLELFIGPGAVADDGERDDLLAALDTDEGAHLAAAAAVTPISCSGHVVRALTFLLWDAGRVYAEARLGSPGDRLLVAIVHDLATS